MAVTTSIDETTAESLLKQLRMLGFKLDQSQKAIAFISKPSAFTKHFTDNLTPLEATIEYLLLHTPEVDLPERFMPANTSSNSFVTDALSGTENIKMRWFEESIAKEGGWPLYLIKEELATAPSGMDYPETLVSKLGMRLLGEAGPLQGEDLMLGDIDPVEVDAYGGITSPGRVDIPLPVSPFTLHIFTSRNSSALFSPPAVHISSPFVPAYVRLHVLSCILQALGEGQLIEDGESFVGACLRIIEEEWAAIEDNGPPDVALVLKHIPPHKLSGIGGGNPDDSPFVKPATARQKERSHKTDKRTDEQVRVDFQRLCANKSYQELLGSRMQLPAFSAREEFLLALEKSRVVIVVGETGNVFWCCKAKILQGQNTKRNY
jgi:ATP-dependent RNA helicase DHX57